jgi:hypothetical protein
MAKRREDIYTYIKTTARDVMLSDDYMGTNPENIRNYEEYYKSKCGPVKVYNIKDLEEDEYDRSKRVHRKGNRCGSDDSCGIHQEGE